MKLAASNIGWRSDDDALVMRHMADLGYTGLEIAPTRFVDIDPYDHVEEACERLDEIKESFGLSVCSMQSIWRGRTESIFSHDASNLLSYTAKAFDYAVGIGCSNLVFGCPANRRRPEGSDMAVLYSFLHDVGVCASERGCSFNLEANPPIYDTNTMNSTADVIAVIEEVGPVKGLGINLDVGAAIEMGEDMRTIERAVPFVRHVHISEPHLAPICRREIHGELADLLKECGYEGFVSLEMGVVDPMTFLECLDYVAEVFR